MKDDVIAIDGTLFSMIETTDIFYRDWHLLIRRRINDLGWAVIK